MWSSHWYRVSMSDLHVIVQSSLFLLSFCCITFFWTLRSLLCGSLFSFHLNLGTSSLFWLWSNHVVTPPFIILIGCLIAIKWILCCDCVMNVVIFISVFLRIFWDGSYDFGIAIEDSHFVFYIHLNIGRSNDRWVSSFSKNSCAKLWGKSLCHRLCFGRILINLIHHHTHISTNLRRSKTLLWHESLTSFVISWDFGVKNVYWNTNRRFTPSISIMSEAISLECGCLIIRNH